ncbi:hypothetical protein [Pseudomonas syringae group genomosp. 3]|uniref:Membrane protein n=1 Tax=Pseudomonas syringae pv. viburni TaxID=251703 RepID=A0A0N8THJ4_9PSED|nr:hypothetical protein [Pseudomonas syringae group genomosp. 3]KPZ24961.1 hypothetical protein ALO40_200016 [Pseudomonas syringae pv. viburni]
MAIQKGRVRPGKCKVVFFDLEFYVPAEKRTASGFCYNPWDKDCRFIGGSFLVANPERDFNIAKSEVLKKTKSFWLWEHPTEKEMLERIYALLKTACDQVKNAHDGAVSAILCGIGITSSDVPILFELFKRFHILSNQEAFSFQNSFRVVDLSQLVIGTFNNPGNLLYPKSKHHILNKYMYGTKFEPGKSVWQLYEAKSHAEIQTRVLDEVYSTHKCYQLIQSDFESFKKLEARNNRQEKLVSKAREAADELSSDVGAAG